MVAKRETQEQERLQQLWHDQMWSRERVREERERELAERRRQQQLAESKAIYQEKVPIMICTRTIMCVRGTSKLMLSSMQLSKIHECRELLEKTQKGVLMAGVDAKWSRWELGASMQVMRDDLRATEKQLETEKKKQLQVYIKKTSWHTSVNKLRGMQYF